MIVNNIAIIPIGIFTSKIRGQLKRSIRKPPIKGPNETDAAAEIPQKPRAIPR